MRSERYKITFVRKSCSSRQELSYKHFNDILAKIGVDRVESEPLKGGDSMLNFIYPFASPEVRHIHFVIRDGASGLEGMKVRQLAVCRALELRLADVLMFDQDLS